MMLRHGIGLAGSRSGAAAQPAMVAAMATARIREPNLFTVMLLQPAQTLFGY
jgi:hypothetical protein